MPEIVFILDTEGTGGRVTVESSQASPGVAKEIERCLGQGTAINCARPDPSTKKSAADIQGEMIEDFGDKRIHLFRLYHHSLVDGPGRRSVVQVAGCSIRCGGCYVPETHERANGRLTPIDEIIREIDERRDRHDGVTILGGEPFDQAESLEILVARLKAKNYHVAVYTGYTLENLLERDTENINRILASTDLLIDGAFERDLARNAGEYRGSSNQRLIFHPVSRKMTDENQNLLADEEGKRRETHANFNESILACLDDGWCPTRCPEGCVVEPDGVCPHNFKSIALELGLI